MKYNCALTVDCVVFSANAVVLIKRKNPPYQGEFALPGGFVDDNETVEDACKREAKEETNLDLKNLVLIGVYSKPNRDPRGRVVSFAFMADAKIEADGFIKAIKSVDRNLISAVEIFDIYSGKGIEPSKKSVAISVTLQPRERTLTDAEIEGISQKIIAVVEQKTGAVLRS